MKLLISTFFTLVLIGVAGGSYGQSILDVQSAAERGSANAQNQMGVWYQNGDRLPKDLARAAGWFRLSADQENPYGQFNLGRLLIDGGLGVRANPREGIALLEKSSKNGIRDGIAATSLGWRYFLGEREEILMLFQT
jgi:uncharacterized protein